MDDTYSYFKDASFDHLGISVKNVDQTILDLQLLTDNCDWEVKAFDYSKDKTWVGPQLGKAKIAFGKVCDMNFEIGGPIHDPDEEQDVDAAAKPVEGFHHLAYSFSSEEAYEKAAEMMLNDGFTILGKFDLIEDRGEPNEHLKKVHILQTKTGNMVFEIFVCVPVS